MILFYINGNTLKIHNPSAETKHYQMPSVNSVLATEDDLTKVTTANSAIIKQPVILTPANNSTGFNGDITFTGFETIETFTGTLDAISIAIATDANFANVVVLQRVEATDAGSFNIVVDLSSSDLYIKVKYHSDLYSSVWSNPVKTTTPEYIINKPTIIGPVNGATGVALFPMISGSDFTCAGVDETHESTTYQIAKDVTFTNIVYNVTSTTDLTSHLITEDLDYETTYYIRMRYNGSKYGNSVWSNTTVINTLEVDEKIISFGDTGFGNLPYAMIHLNDYVYVLGARNDTNTTINKFDKKGNLINTLTINPNDSLTISLLLKGGIVDREGNLVVYGYGYTNETGSLNSYIYLTKINPITLTIIKEIRIDSKVGTNLRFHDDANDLIQDSDGNYIITGYSKSPATYNATSEDGMKILLLKINNTLDNILNSKSFGLANVNSVGYGSYYVDDNNIYGFGRNDNGNIIIFKYNKNLDVLAKYNYYLGVRHSGWFKPSVLKNGIFYLTAVRSGNNGDETLLLMFDLQLNLTNNIIINNDTINVVLNSEVHIGDYITLIGNINNSATILKLSLDLNLLDNLVISGGEGTAFTDLVKDANYYTLIGYTTISGKNLSMLTILNDDLAVSGTVGIYNISKSSNLNIVRNTAFNKSIPNDVTYTPTMYITNINYLKTNTAYTINIINDL